MPQELHVVQCCTCEMFQVDIVKKVPKWSCKMCGEKQSLKKVFGKGTGKECRLLVQQLNQNKGLKESTSCTSPSIENTSVKMNECFSSARGSNLSSNMQSKWSEFTCDNDTDEEVAERKFSPEEIETDFDLKEIQHSSNNYSNTVQNEKAKFTFDCRIKEKTVETKEEFSERVKRTKLEPEVHAKESASSIFEDDDVDAINFD